MQSARGKEFTPAESDRLEGYRRLLRESFASLGYPPGDIAVRTPEWKLILRKNRPLLEKVSWWGFITGTPQRYADLELYDLKNDPLEQTNVAAGHPDVVGRLRQELEKWDASMEKKKAVYAPADKRMIIPYP
jgi:hypothetical protein